jgi:hypothetical protein
MLYKNREQLGLRRRNDVEFFDPSAASSMIEASIRRLGGERRWMESVFELILLAATSLSLTR